MNTQANKNYSILLLLAGTLLVGFSMGRWLAPLAAWIGPILIMRYARDHKAGRGYLLLLTASILTMVISFWATFEPMLFVIIAVLYGLLLSLPYLVDRLMFGRLKGFSSTFVFPLAATTLEFVNVRANPMGDWAATGFTQYGNLPLMQIASVTGMIGITFLMGWFASVVNWAWENRSRGVEFLRGLAAFGMVLTVVFIFGFLRLNLAPSKETVRVAGITPASGYSLFVRLGEMSDPEAIQQAVQSHWDKFFAATVREAQAGAKIIVWSEGTGVTPFSNEAAFVAQAQEVARQNGIYLAMGIVGFDLNHTLPYANKLVMIDPSGTIVMEHYKYGGAIMEGYRVQGNKKLQTVITPFGVLSGVVCWDLDYHTVIQQAGSNGTGLLLVPSKDWLAIDPIHSYMAVFAAIENGMSIVRQTEDGLSIAADPYGRVLGRMDSFGSTDRTLVAQVPAAHAATVYTAFGHWFEWLCMIGFLIVVARALMAHRHLN